MHKPNKTVKSLVIIITLFLASLVVNLALAYKPDTSLQNAPSAIAAFTPLDLAPDLWLDGSDNATLTLSGNDVLGWDDKSGNANHAAPPATENTPIYDAASKFIIFDGVDDVLTVNNIDYGSNNDVSVFVVAQADSTSSSTGNNGWVIGNGPYSSGNEFAILFHTYYSWKGYNGYVNGIGNQVSDDTSGYAGFDLDPHTVGMIYDGEYLVPRLDGKTVGGRAATPYPLDQDIGIGSDAKLPGYSPFEGRVAEVFIFRRALDSCEASLLEAYIADKWGFPLPDEHLFKTVQFAICPDQPSFTVAEDAANGSSIGIVPIKTLSNSITAQNWQIIDSDHLDFGIFAIDPVSGEITVADNTKLDYETSQRHVLRLTVSDGVETAVPVDIAIEVTDVDDGETKQHSLLWGANGELWDPRGRLPDFSHAGYHAGEQTIPNIPVVTNVLDYGAIPDDGLPDHVAIQAAIDATASGAVYLPAGTYLIEDTLMIENSNIILRGDGDDVGGTILYNSETQWAIEAKGGNYYGAGLGHIVEPAKRGDRTLTVADNHTINAGEIVLLKQSDDASPFGSFWQHLHNNQVRDIFDGCGWAGANGLWIHHVERVDGNLITLKEPLNFDIRLEWSPAFQRFDHIEEVGIEDLRIELPYIPPPPHLQEPGYGGIHFGYIANSWIKNVTIHDSDNAIVMSWTAWTTLEDIASSGRRGHHIITLDSYADYNLLKNITANSDNDPWIHAVTFIHKATGNVLMDVQGNQTIHLDFHRNAPLANLVTEVHTDWDYNSSGAGCAGPHGGARQTFWNLTGAAGAVQNNPNDVWGHMQTNVINTLSTPELLTENREWYEAVTNLQPANLHTAQLSRRLRHIELPFSPEPDVGVRANWFERDPARWQITNEGNNLSYELYFGNHPNISGDRLGEYSVYSGNIISPTITGTGGTEINVWAKTNEDLSNNSAADYALILGYQDDENYLYALFSTDAVQTGIYRVEDGVRTTLTANPGFSLSDNAYHEVAFKRTGNSIAASFDGTEIMNAVDNDFTSGDVGIGSFDDSARFDIGAPDLPTLFNIYLPAILK